MTELQCLRVILETVDVEDLLGFIQSSTLDTEKLVMKGSILLAKEIASSKTESDPKEKVKKWERCLKAAKTLRSKANEIPPDSMTDHAWRMLTQPWWSSVLEYSKAAVSNKDLKNMNKNSTIEKFDLAIEYIEYELDRAKKKSEQ